MPKGLMEDCEVRREEKVRIITADDEDDLELEVNKFIEEEVSYIKRIKVFTYVEKVGILIHYDAKREKIEYTPPTCAGCGASEDDRHGIYENGKFICNECIREKFNLKSK